MENKKVLNIDKCMICGEKSAVACHGIINNEVYNEYYCDKHYNMTKKKKKKDNK